MVRPGPHPPGGTGARAWSFLRPGRLQSAALGREETLLRGSRRDLRFHFRPSSRRLTKRAPLAPDPTEAHVIEISDWGTPASQAHLCWLLAIERTITVRFGRWHQAPAAPQSPSPTTIFAWNRSLPRGTQNSGSQWTAPASRSCSSAAAGLL